MLVELFAVALWALAVQGNQYGGIHLQFKAPPSTVQIWPYGIVYYEVDHDLQSIDKAMDGIKRGMSMWSDKTCVRFERRINEDAYIYFYLGGDCYSEIGRSGYKQFVSLAPHCWKPGEAAHFIGLALGLYPEQSRYDRDSYVRINWNNIRDDAKPRFTKYPKGVADIKGFDYDYQSIMHFKEDAYTKNGAPTIEVPQTSDVGIGQRNGPSVIDVEKIHFLYHCNNPGGGGGEGGHTSTTLRPTTPRPTAPRTTTQRCTPPQHTTQRSTTFRASTPQPTRPGVCKDKWSYFRCTYLKGAGWCYKNPEVMKHYCTKTCNKCTAGGGACTDKLMYCKTWAKHGWCTSKRDYMEYYCKMSCNFCGNGAW